MREWALQDATARLSEVVHLAMEHAPQTITLRGKPAVVVLSRKDHDALTRRGVSLVEFMRNSPLYDADDVQFDRELSRNQATL